MSRRLVPVVLEVLVLLGAVAVAGPPAKHPNLLLSADEIQQVKAKIARYPWAAAALEKTRQHALDGPTHENACVNQALCYAFSGEKSGASIKSVIDGYLLMGYPLERTGIGRGRGVSEPRRVDRLAAWVPLLA